MAEHKYVRYRDCRVGETIVCDGQCTITIEEKSGRKPRLKIESASPIHFYTEAHMCRENSLKEGENHGTNYLRRE